MAKKYQKKDKDLPMGVDYCGLNTASFLNLNKGKIVELDEVPDKAKDFLVEVKDQKSEKIKKVKVEAK